MPNIYDQQVGLLNTGEVESFDPKTGYTLVKLTGQSATKGVNALPVRAEFPAVLSMANGLFIGALPVAKTKVVIGQGEGGPFHITSPLIDPFDINPLSQPIYPKVPLPREDELLIQANDDTKISINLNGSINLGSDLDKLYMNAGIGIISTNFDNSYLFTKASRKINGAIKRKSFFNVNTDSYENESEDSIIGLDPTKAANFMSSGQDKNPAFVESRELIYEFDILSQVSDQLTESKYYLKQGKNNISKYKDRRKNRSETLSLTLAYPNHLMETVKGTVVDIYGNILDINRYPLPIGEKNYTLRTDENKDKAYLSIREQQRKSVAFHFELNARKDFATNAAFPDINSNINYSKNRSRFFVDIDKEGMFKINIPASSDKGNVPLLTRYENYSTFAEEDENDNPNRFFDNSPDNIDIYQDSFAVNRFDNVSAEKQIFTYIDDQHLLLTDPNKADKGSIKILNENAVYSPIDRITKTHIKHGTAYHDVLSTCFAHQVSKFVNWDSGKNKISPKDFPLLSNIASDTINISGANANAGGRSGSINLDGSIDLNIGANNIDKQSIWLDTQGGMIANFGKDKNDRSALISTDGSVFLQVGAFEISSDGNLSQNNKPSTLDIRVLNSQNRATIIRIDETGNIILMSPATIQIHAAKGLQLTSDQNIDISAENVRIQERHVNIFSDGMI